MKTPRVKAVKLAPKLEELQKRIELAQALNAASIDDKRISDLFLPLLGVDHLALSQLRFDAIGQDILQLDAQTTVYGKTVSIAAVFNLSGDVLNLCMNNMGEGFTMSLREMVQDGLIPPSGSYPLDSWPDVAISGISFVLDSSTNTNVIKTGGGAKWEFLGYTNLFIDQPGINVVMTASGPYASYSVQAVGTLKSKKDQVDIPVVIQLPTGLNSWKFGIAAPVSLDNALSIIDALADTQVSALLPNEFSAKLETVVISAFSVKFDPSTLTIYSLGLQVTTTEDWVIVTDKLSFEKNILVNFNASRNKPGTLLKYTGSITGSAKVNYSDPEKIIIARASIPIPLTDGQDWEISLGNTADQISLTRLIGVVPLVSDILPKGLMKELDKIIVDSLSIKFKYEDEFSFTHVAFSIHSDEVWQLPMIQSAVYLDGIQFELDVPFPYDSSTTTGSLEGNIQIADGTITIPVLISKTESDENWMLGVTSDEILLPSISDLSDFMGDNILVSASPSGLMGIGNFAIYDLDLVWEIGTSKLDLFAFTIQSTPDTPAWNLIPDYFTLSDLSVSLKIENKTVSEKDISGSIGATVVLVLNKEKDQNLVLGMNAIKPGTDKPWNFNGSLQEDFELSALLLGLKLPQDVVSLLPNLTVTQFDLAMEPSSRSFSTSMTIRKSAEEHWTIISVGTTEITLEELFFKVDHYAENTDLEARGSFNIGTVEKKCEVVVQATYKQKIWNFTGSFKNDKDLSINDVLKKYINGIDASTIPQLSITDISVSLVKGPSESAETSAYSTLDFGISGELKINVIEAMTILADVNVLYDSRKEPANQYDGTTLKGTLQFGGLSFSVLSEYENDKFSKFVFEIDYKKIKARCEADTSDPDIVSFKFELKSTDPNKGLSLGDLITTLIGAATGETPDIPSPWDFINNIPLDTFGFVFTYDKKTKAKTIGVTYRPNINLGFITINELSLIYSPGAEGDQGPVDFKVTDGTFLGIDIDKLPQKDKPDWDLRKPEDAPAVPGMGDAAFKLENLSLGNQVAILNGKPPKSIVEAITELENAFKPEEEGDKLPTTLYFDKNYGWLIGAQFTLIKYIDVAVIFYDPVIYGLSIDVKGGQFNGLYFQVLYKKITDNVGVFQIDLTLPDFVRKQQFGAVSVTLPSISLSIYTNGDFMIDMGFPYNGNFERSFALEFSIFSGAGGFYFGKLSNDTATDFNLPTADGQFNPVIAFGIGIKAGVGRSVDKGILKAEMSLTIQVILEGIIAYYEGNPKPGNSDVAESGQYFRIKAQAGLVGHIYGEINFVIISASVDITAKILAELLIEAYRKTEITFTAEVSASVEVRINLGLFSISISCSFSTTISDSFTMGSDEHAPWDGFALPDRSAYFSALDKSPTIIIPEMDWKATMDYTQKKDLNILFLPQVSVKYKADAPIKKQGVAVSLLYLNNEVNSGADSDFTALSRALLAWTFNAYFSKKEVHETEILRQKVTIDDLNSIYAYLNQDTFADGNIEPFGTDELLNYFFAQGFTEVNLKTKSETSQENLGESNQTVAIFPMFPVFKMLVSGKEDIDFSKFGPCDTEYLKAIKAYFDEMKIQFNKEQNPVFQALLNENPGTLAEFLFIDYFVMMAKSGIQDAINNFKQMTLTVEKGQSLNDIVRKHKHLGVSLESLSKANRHKTLSAGINVHIPAFAYHLKEGETVHDLLGRLPEFPDKKLMLSARKTTRLNARKQTNNPIQVPAFNYKVSANAKATTLWSVSEHFKLDLNDLVQENAAKKNLFATGTRLVHAFVDEKTVLEILDYLQTGDKFSLSNLGGTVSRFFLHGLRIPADVAATSRKGLFEATGQQFEMSGITDESSVSLQINDESVKPEWLNFESADETKFDFTTELVSAAGELEQASLDPLMLDTQDQAKRYELQAKTFTLPTGTRWMNPNSLETKADLTDSYLWKFPSKLQQYLSDNPNLPFELLMQSKNTSFSLEESVNVTPLFWSTSVQMKIQQIPSPTNAGEVLEMVYQVQGCGEADGALLQELILAVGPPLKNLDILFDENKSKDNDGKEVSGLLSDGLDKFRTFLLQTNYSTVSNPSFSVQDNAMAELSPNLVGMDAITFLTYLWECSVVRSGGYYLSYNNGSGGGLPSHIFDENGNATVTLLVSFDIPINPVTNAFSLPTYVNSVVINKQILANEDNLYLEVYLNEIQKEQYNPLLQDIHATILPGTGLFRGTRINPGSLQPANLTESADAQLRELFNLLEYRINQTEDVFIETKFALPAGPTVVTSSPLNSITTIPRRALVSDGWIYQSVLPIYPFVVVPPTQDRFSSAAFNQDPYASNGKTATVFFNFLDVFGNSLIDDNAAQPEAAILQNITPGYLDSVIGLDQWTNVSKHYNVMESETDLPLLNINLEFDTSSYVNAEDPKKMAEKDLLFYQNIAYQLAQPDIQVSVNCNIGSFEIASGTPISIIRNFVADIMAFLRGISAGNTTDSLPVKSLLPFEIDPEKLNTNLIFALSVEIEIERTSNIDPQFVDEPGIRFATSAIPPNLYKQGTDDQSALSIFANDLETALPIMKVALGQSKVQDGPMKVYAERMLSSVAESTDDKEIWLIRYAKTSEETGIQFTVDPIPVYFATKPLSTKLISRPDEQHPNPVPIRNYISGQYLGNEEPVYKSYSGIDMELLAVNFISVLDNFLSAQMSTNAWLVQYDPKTSTSNDPQTEPFQDVEQAKKDIAAAIANHQLTNILQDQNLDGLDQAKSALEQQLLINLGKAYSINAVMQNKVRVEQGFDAFTANFYGKLETVGTPLQTNAYDLTPVKIPITRSDDSFIGPPTMTSFFSVRPESNSEGLDQEINLIDEFKAKLNYSITSIEHNFGTPIHSYVPSSWLVLANPIVVKGELEAPLIEADIPIPLKAYPTAPSMISQTGEAAYPKPENGDGKKALEDAKKWNYDFNYDYISALQDIIYMNIRFNVKSGQVNALNVNELDLFEALMQFNNSYLAVLTDLEKKDANSLVALQSFAWLVRQVANAWNGWFSQRNNALSLANHELNFLIQESKGNGDEKILNVLYLTISSDESNPPGTSIPDVKIDGFETLTYTGLQESNSKTYYFRNLDGSEELLLFNDRKKFSKRQVILKDNNILLDENAWAGVSIHRNEILTGKPTNVDFRYITPYIRFAEPCLPSLYNETKIDIADFTPGVSKDNKARLDTLLLNLFIELYKGLVNPDMVLQLRCGYTYNLQQGSIQLGPTLPIILTTPTSTSLQNLPELLANLSAAVNNWLIGNQVSGVDKDGELSIELSLYSSLSEDVRNPVLKLEGLFLKTDLIQLS